MQSSSPQAIGWAATAYDMLNFGASYVTGYLAPSEEEPTAIPGRERTVEKLAFIICMAVRGFLGEGFKPSLENYHIVWDPPNDKKVINALTISKQGFDRSFKGKAKRQIMKKWDLDTVTALKRYNPFSEEKLEEQEFEKKRRVQIREFFELAIVGFEATPGPYKGCSEEETQDIILTLEKCASQIRDDRHSKRTYISDGSDPALEEPKEIWNAATIDYIHYLFQELKEVFQELKELPVNKNAIQLKRLYDTVAAIQAIVNKECTKWAIAEQKALFSRA